MPQSGGKLHVLALDCSVGACTALLSPELKEQLHAMTSGFPGSARVHEGIVVRTSQATHLARMFPFMICAACANDSPCLFGKAQLGQLGQLGYRHRKAGLRLDLGGLLHDAAQVPMVASLLSNVFGVRARDASSMLNAAAEALKGRRVRRTERAAPKRERVQPPQDAHPCEAHARVLGLDWPCNADDVGAAFKDRITKAHPDHGGTNARTQRLVEARNALLKELGK